MKLVFLFNLEYMPQCANASIFPFQYLTVSGVRRCCCIVFCSLSRSLCSFHFILFLIFIFALQWFCRRFYVIVLAVRFDFLITHYSVSFHTIRLFFFFDSKAFLFDQLMASPLCLSHYSWSVGRSVCCCHCNTD